VISNEYNIPTKTLPDDVANNILAVAVTEKKTQSNRKIKTVTKKQNRDKKFYMVRLV
jgi:hypothetical protein